MKKKNIRNCLQIFSLVCFLLLAGCATRSEAVMSELNIYQPSILILEKGVEIQTKTGKYKPQTEEAWYPEKTVRELERRGY